MDDHQGVGLVKAVQAVNTAGPSMLLVSNSQAAILF